MGHQRAMLQAKLISGWVNDCVTDSAPIVAMLSAINNDMALANSDWLT